ncbi:MAG: sialidase family protein [Planctomycetota bacterium]
MPVTELLLLSLLIGSPNLSAEVPFVAAGHPVEVGTLGEPWEEAEGFLRGGGVGRFLRAGRDLGRGDLRVRARLTLERIEGTAASVCIGGASHFGLDGRGRDLFVEGPLFGGPTRSLGPASRHIEAGHPFTLELVRRGTSLVIRIDGTEVHREELAPDLPLGSLQLRPWRGVLRVHELHARGDLLPLPPPLAEDALWISGEGGYHTYRIPALVTTNRGTLLAFCEGRRHGSGDSGDIDLLLRRSDDGGRTWSPSRVILDDGPNTCGNPCPVVDRESGAVILLTTGNDGADREADIIAGRSRDSRRVHLLRSEDDGLTWSGPEEITADTKRPEWTWYATGPGSGIQLRRGPQRGRLVVPCDHIESGTRRYFSHALLSDDGGRSWRIGGRTPRDQVNECAVAELADGTLLLNMRNYDRSRRLRQSARSRDGGESWTGQRFEPGLPEPICQASLIAVPTVSGVHLHFSNPASDRARERMTLRRSLDGGHTWSTREVLHSGPSAYSSLTHHPERGVLCLFEAGEAHPYEAIVLRAPPPLPRPTAPETRSAPPPDKESP